MVVAVYESGSRVGAMLITMSGLPGSGKTTVARLISRELGIPHVYAGDLFRKEAKERGLSLADYNRLAEDDHGIDRALDDRMAVYAREGNVVIEGRLAGYVACQEDVPSLKVWLSAKDDTRARRVAQREDQDWRDVLEMNRVRHASDLKRYLAIYGYDLEDTSIYDILLESDDKTPETLAADIVRIYRQQFPEDELLNLAE